MIEPKNFCTAAQYISHALRNVSCHLGSGFQAPRRSVHALRGQSDDQSDVFKWMPMGAYSEIIHMSMLIRSHFSIPWSMIATHLVLIVKTF